MEFSIQARRNLLATSAEEPNLVALEIYHKDLPEPIRVVNDVQPLWIDGHKFEATAFEIILPDSKDQQVPQARLSVDNVGRELTQWLEISRGGAGAKCRILLVLRSQTDGYADDYFAEDYVYGDEPVIEFDITMDLTDLSITVQRVTGLLGFQNTLHRPAVAFVYDPKTAPGLY